MMMKMRRMSENLHIKVVSVESRANEEKATSHMKTGYAGRCVMLYAQLSFAKQVNQHFSAMG
jgi:hypothetical protein